MAAKEDIALTIERQAAARRLLADPIITARSHPEDFALVHAHSDWLIRSFERVLGYDLTVADDHARLVKSGLVRAVATPLHRASGAPFTPRAYTYLALTLAALAETAPRTAVTELAAAVREAADEAGLDLDPESRLGERRAFVAGLVRLASWGALTVTSGDLADYAVDGSAEVGLAVDHAIAARIPAHPPHATADPRAFIARAENDAAAPDDRAAELTLRRLLAETTVVYRAELAPAHRARLTGHQWRAAAELTELLGCEAEIRAEGVALVMPGDAAADARGTDQHPAFPGSGPVGRAALTLLARLTAALAPPPFSHAVPIPAGLLRAGLAAAVDDDATRDWTRTATSHVPDPDALTERVLRLLVDSRLLEHAPDGGGLDDDPMDGWRLLAAAARYRDAVPAQVGGTE
ncbi:DUF2398 family protein [Actinorugispora endophytica]|uniref:Uncharacterized protein (TIGR02678 family) n=1 Tax=Actinorugispora endophytica TaxID=1605990 RepID=A0A4R6V0P1_9ACTN|nr:DUF2398 family protein [Actinorugispora endophytica]TDQ51505.1 uncharacterized protein (TIGR02678 family) [Actinorugispora endophytica]